MSLAMTGRRDPAWEDLVGREPEKATLDAAIRRARAGRSSVLVLSGSAGLGKSALLDALAMRVTPLRVLRVAGVESDLELAFAGIHQLCLPLLDDLSALPGPQRTALQVIFGLSDGDAPDRFLIGLAVLSLLANAASSGPVLCIVDDVQWLDEISALVLAFVARRLDSESIAMVFATREVSTDLAGFDQVPLAPLSARDARHLLDAALPLDVDDRVRDQIVAETRGNPLGLVELPRDLSPADLAGGYGLPTAVGGPSDAEQIYRRRCQALPDADRQLVMLAAADPTGDPTLLRRAAAVLGLDGPLGDHAATAGLIDLGARVRFRHPLARSAAYATASRAESQRAHAALAEATDAATDPDRRAWHRGRATDQPDEDVAADLEASAERALARGGVSAAGAFLERAALLSLDPLERARRAVGAAQVRRRAGDPEAARELLDAATSGPLSEADAARADVLRALLDAADSWGGDLPGRLLDVARRLSTLDSGFARMAHADAIYASLWADQLARPGSEPVVTVTAALEAGTPAATPVGRELLGDLSVDDVDDLPAPLGSLLLVLRDHDDPSSYPDGGVRWFALAGLLCAAVGDNERWRDVARRSEELCSRLGAVTDRPAALTSLLLLAVIEGDLERAARLAREVTLLSTALGTPAAPAELAQLAIAAHRGQVDEVEAQHAAAVAAAEARGEGSAMNIATWARAVLENGRGQYEKAASLATRVAAHEQDVLIRKLALVEAVEALVRSGRSEAARSALVGLEQTLRSCSSDWMQGLLARCRALVARPDSADVHYLEAVERLERSGCRGELARARLLHGEWLRRERRRSEARTQLRAAREALEEIGMGAFAERAARELWATGENAGRPTALRDDVLTAQESQIALLARDGLTNPQIGERLFISARTVEYHLSKVFTKLDISARTQLGDALGES